MRELMVDTETTGRSWQSGDRVVSLGLVELIHGRKTGREKEWFFNPDRKSSDDARRVHGISDRWLAEQPRFFDVRHDIEDWIGDAILVAHHAPFDRGFLNNEFALCLGLSTLTDSDRNRYPPERWQDSLRLARKRFPKQPNTLDALADRFGIYRGHRIRHGALKDARILADVWIELQRGGQGSLFDGLPEHVPERLWQPPTIDYAARTPPPSRLTSAEMDRWRKMWVEEPGEKAIWNDYLEAPQDPQG